MTKARELSELAKAVTIVDNRIDFDRSTQFTGTFASTGIDDNASSTAITINSSQDVTLTGSLIFADNEKAIFGAGSDLQIYHNGTNSIIEENSGAGSLIIKGTNISFEDGTGAETYATFIKDGAATIRYDNSTKLTTTSTGIDVTGTATMDGLTVDGDITLNDNSPTIIFDDANGVDQNFTFAVNGGTANIQSRTDAGVNTTRFKISTNGDISFYEDTGTTPKFFWDASTERLGIGTSSLSFDLQLSKSSAPTIRIEETTNNVRLDLRSNSDHTLIRTTSNHDMRFNTNQVDRMTIKNNGNVGIGTSSPDGKLHVHTASAGSVTANSVGDDLIVENNGDGGITILTPDANRSALFFGHASDNNKMQIRHDGNTSLSEIISDDSLNLTVGNGLKRINIGTGGDISFYEDTGTTPKLFWDSSAECLNVGTTTSEGNFNVNISTPSDYPFRLTNTSSTGYGLLVTAGNGSNALAKFRDYAGNDRVYISGAGNVGIGTTNPLSKLTVAEAGNIVTTLKPTVGIIDTTSGATLGMRGQSPKIAFDVTSSGVPKILMDNAGLEFKTGTLDAEGDVDFKIASSGYLEATSGSQVRLTLGSEGTAGTNTANWIRGVGTSLSFNSASGGYQWEIGGGEKMRISSGGQLSLATTDATHGFNVGQSGTDFRGRFQGNNQYRLGLQNGTSNLVWLGSGGADNFRVSNSGGSTLMEVTSSGQVVASSFSGGGLGKIAQVQNVEKLDTFSTNTTSPDGVAITGMQVNITPSSTSSKVLVTVSLGAIGCSTSSSRTTTFQLYRGATQIAEGNADGSRPRVTFRSWMTSGDTNHALGGLSFSFLDSPSSTSALSYKLHMSGSHASDTFYLNRSGADSNGGSNYQSRTVSTMQCMEVLA